MIAPAALAVSYNYNYSLGPTNTSGGGAAAAGAGVLALVLILAIFALVIAGIVAMWRVYSKAGKPGWAAIVPVYNSWVLAEIAGKPGWWGLLPFVAFVPIIGWIAAIVVTIIIAVGVARNFGKSDAFGVVGLFIFSFIGYMILGFGSATYKGASVPTTPAAPMMPSQPVPPAA